MSRHQQPSQYSKQASTVGYEYEYEFEYLLTNFFMTMKKINENNTLHDKNYQSLLH